MSVIEAWKTTPPTRIPRWRLTATLLAVLAAALPLEAQKTAKEAEAIPEWEKYKPFRHPGENHRLLDSLEGTWTTTLRAWLHGSPPPEVALDARLEARWILDGRYLQLDYRHTGPELDLEGRYYFGYDPIEGHYYNLLIANDHVIPLHSKGAWDGEKKTLSFRGIEYDPVTGDSFEKREHFTFLAPDRIGYELRYGFSDGTEIKAAEGTFTTQPAPAPGT